jgi:hypothetical protein
MRSDFIADLAFRTGLGLLLEPKAQRVGQSPDLYETSSASALPWADLEP